MLRYLFVLVLLISFELAYLMLAKKFDVVDRPHYQSSHTGAIIRGGGIGFYFAYLLWFIISGLQYPMILLGISITAITSFIDDIHSISPKIRLVLQFLAMIVMLYETEVFTLRIQSVFLLSVVCVFAVNIYNFMDGINGMTGGYSLVVLISLLYVNNNIVPFVDNDLLMFVLLADGLFCILNFRTQAKCFAGDVGSLTMGYIVIFLILMLMFKAGHMNWIAFVSVYLVDGGMTILHRIMLSENVMKPHKKHVYQIMVNELGMSHLSVSLLYMGLQALCNAWFIMFTSNIVLLVQFVFLSSLYLLFIYKYYPLHANK